MDPNSDNPYQSPLNLPQAIDASLQPPPPRFRLFSIGAVLLATFLGSWFAGSVLLAINYWQLGRTASAWLSVLVGLVATAALVTAAMLLPENTPGVLFLGVQLLTMYFLAGALQSETIDWHVAKGGGLISKWLAAGLAILVCIPLAILLIAVAMLLDHAAGNQHEVGSQEEIYQSVAAPAKAHLR